MESASIEPKESHQFSVISSLCPTQATDRGAHIYFQTKSCNEPNEHEVSH